MKLYLDPDSLSDYQTFLKVKALPTYKITGRMAEFPDEYAERLGVLPPDAGAASGYVPHQSLFDYQKSIASMAIDKRKFAVFADPGLGKTLIQFEYARHTVNHLPADRCTLIVCPPMVVNQHLSELRRFYGDNESDGNVWGGPVRQVLAAELQDWLLTGTERVGITNYEALKPNMRAGRLGCLIADESAIMKSAYGKWGQWLIQLGKGIEWKLALTGCAAPNDREEYAGHAVFLDQVPNVNAFLAKYFVNRGQTQNRWELKPHALEPFYRSLSHWCIFLSNPATYGWQDNCGTIPPIETSIEHVDLTKEQEKIIQRFTGGLFAHRIGGITSRGALGQIAKGNYKGQEIPTNKPAYIKRLVDSWKADESTIIWCLYNEEQNALASLIPDSASIDGKMPVWRRVELLEEFKSRKRPVLISKARVLGFGLNLQVATRHIFSALQDSYEAYFQCIKRSNRIGSTRPLRVHIPVTDIEREMVDNVLRKAKRVQADTEAQERIFKKVSVA